MNHFNDYFKFAFVRNPWDRLVSCWNNKVIDSNLFRFNDTEREKMNFFENFVSYVESINVDTCNRHLRLQNSLIDLNNIDYLGRMETFGDDLNSIFRRLDLDTDNIKSRNVTTERQPYREYYNSELAERVARIYRKDLQIFGYRFQGYLQTINKIHEVFAKTFLVKVSTLVSFAILEAAANIWLLHFADEKYFIRHASLQQLQESDISNHPRYSPHRYVDYYPTPNYVKGKDRHNTLGYRGEEIIVPKPAGEFRIACLGGSTTYSSEVKDYRDSYPYQLEKTS